MFAAGQNDLYLANIFLSNHCDVNLVDSNMRNALFYAINAQGDVYDMVLLLISNGINVNQVDRDGQSPLTQAVYKGDKEVTRILLNSEVNVDHQTNDGNTALHYAVSNNRPELIYLLLLRRPDLNLRNKNDQTPMDIATVLSRTEVYQILAEEYNQREANAKRVESGEYESEIQEDGVKANSLNAMTNIKFLEKEEPVRTGTIEFISHKSTDNVLNVNTMNLQGSSNFNTNNSGNFANLTNQNNFLHNNFQGNNLQGNNFHRDNMPQISMQIGNQNFSSNPNGVNNLNNINNNVNNSNSQSNFNNFFMSQFSSINMPMNNHLANRGGMPFTHKFTKMAKFQKLKYLQERNQMASGKQVKDKVFKFPFNQNNNLTNIEIPFSFQSNSSGSLGNAPNQGNRFTKGNQLHTFISNNIIIKKFNRHLFFI